MTIEAVVIDVQVMRVPPDREGRRHTPEPRIVEMIVERVPRGVGVVVHRVGARIVVIDRARLVDDHFLGLVVRHVDDVFLHRGDRNSARLLGDELVVVRLQIAGGVGAVAEIFDGGDDIGLLADNCFAQAPGPVEILVEHLDDFRVVEQCDDRIVPIRVRFQRRVLLQVLEETAGLDDLQGVGGCRQHDREQVVRVQGDRAHELFNLLGGNHRQLVNLLDFGDRDLGVGCAMPGGQQQYGPQVSKTASKVLSVHGASGAVIQGRVFRSWKQE